MKGLYIFFCLITAPALAQEAHIIFEDTFDAPFVDETSWNFETGDGCPNLCGWGNNERQVYTKENTSIKNGYLVIKADKKGDIYTSSRLTTKKKVEFQYGIIEVRAKLPGGHGLWPAIWMLGNDIDSLAWPACGEIDMVEYVGKQPDVLHTSLHTPSSYGETINTKKTTVKNIEEDFHVFKTKWTKDSIQFYIDDTLLYSFAPEVKNKNTWPFNKPFYVLINMAIGGNFGGPEVDNSIFPKEFLIDYIKITKL